MPDQTALHPNVFGRIDQNLELFHHAGKLLLAARGALSGTTVWELRVTLEPEDIDHIQFVNRKILRLLDSLAMPRNPAVGTMAAPVGNGSRV